MEKNKFLYILFIVILKSCFFTSQKQAKPIVEIEKIITNYSIDSSSTEKPPPEMCVVFSMYNTSNETILFPSYNYYNSLSKSVGFQIVYKCPANGKEDSLNLYNKTRKEIKISPSKRDTFVLCAHFEEIDQAYNICNQEEYIGRFLYSVSDTFNLQYIAGNSKKNIWFVTRKEIITPD